MTHLDAAITAPTISAISFLPTLPTWGVVLLALVPPAIVLLYFLKLRREPVEVPSTYLWQTTIEDLHVNSLLQRLRRSLLLLLQLLAVAAAAFALFRPGIRGTASQTPRQIFLIDTSASMSARDGGEALSDATTRLDRAIKLVGGAIDGMSDDESAMLITFDDRSETLQSFTGDRGRLNAALQRVRPTARPTDIIGALRAADGLANPRRSSEVGDTNDVQVADAMPADLKIYSDGGFDTVTEFSLGNLKPTYVPIGQADTANAAITAFSVQRNVERPGMVEAFATVSNLSSETIEGTATLRGDGEFLDAASVSIDGEDQTGVSFSFETENAMTLELTLDVEDALAVDNQAFAALTPLRTVSVLLVTPGNKPLELGFGTSKVAGISRTEVVSPSYLSTDAYRSRAKEGSDDLIVYDRCRPDAMPSTNTFFIGSLPPSINQADADGDPNPSPQSGDEDVDVDADVANDPSPDNIDTRSIAGESPTGQWRYASPMESLSVIDVDRGHPLMRYLELFSLLVVEGQSVEGPPGTDVLIEGDIGPLLSIAPRQGFRDLVLGFALLSQNAEGASVINTNWYAERSWPVFLLNVLKDLAGAAEASAATSQAPGSTVRLRVPQEIRSVNITPVGEPTAPPIPVPDNGLIEFVDTELPGNYRVESEGKLIDLFSINLFDRTESTLAVKPDVEIGYETVEGVNATEETRQEYWRWALLAVLGLMAAEWVLYSRRVA